LVIDKLTIRFGEKVQDSVAATSRLPTKFGKCHQFCNNRFPATWVSVHKYKGQRDGRQPLINEV
jgi:cytochrome P450